MPILSLCGPETFLSDLLSRLMHLMRNRRLVATVTNRMFAPVKIELLWNFEVSLEQTVKL